MGDRETGKIEGFRRRQSTGRKVGGLKSWEKRGNRGTIMQQCLIFRNLKGLKGGSREKRSGSWEYMLKAGGLDASAPPPPPTPTPSINEKTSILDEL